jgi:polysaccharide pyruvyl transferase WcaK-like protein
MSAPIAERGKDALPVSKSGSELARSRGRGLRTRLLELTRGLLLSINRFARRLHLEGGGVLVIPPSASGSLGDEAMLVGTVDAIRRQFNGRIGLIRYRRGADYPVQVDRIVDLSRYFHQGGARGDELRLLLALLSYRHVALLGADVLDGFYSDDAVRLRLRLVELAASARAETSILGFSFNATPSSRSIEMLRSLPPSVRLFARDHLSHGRLSANTQCPVQRVADTAFLLVPNDADPRVGEVEAWSAGIRSAGGLVLGVNLCAIAMEAAGLSATSAVSIAAATLQQLLAARPVTGLLLIPHDVRGDSSDALLLQRLAEHLAKDQLASRLRLLRPPMSARFVKAICASVDLVWTGRMHLAVAALGQGIPAVAHEYQDKFGGLFSDFGIAELLWPPHREATPQALSALLIDALDRSPSLRASIASKLPAVVALAQRNIGLMGL